MNTAASVHQRLLNTAMKDACGTNVVEDGMSFDPEKVTALSRLMLS